MADESKMLLGIMELIEAKRLKEKMGALGVDVELGHNKETCTKGCRVTVEVWAEREHLPKIQEVLKEERAKLLSDLDFDPELEDQVFDPSEKTDVCPACGTQFPTNLKECPECGLVFMAK